MPGPDALTWTDYSDFTGGLWERQTERECPKNGLLRSEDCYPQPTGGLRAFMSFEPLTQAGIHDNVLILGLWRPSPSIGYMFCVGLQIDGTAAGSHIFRIYALDATSISSLRTGTWTNIHATSGVTAVDSSIQMVGYRTSATGYDAYVNLPVQQTGSASTGGILKITPALAMSRPVSTGTAYVNALAVHQARLLYSGVLLQIHGRVHMTDPADNSSSTNFFDPIGEKSAPITWMMPSAPSDLIIGKSTWGVILTQGDALNPVSREMAFSQNFLHSFPCVMENGAVAFMVASQGCYAFTQGGLQLITPNFYGTPMNPGVYPLSFNTINFHSTKLATPTVSGNFLFMGNGYVMDQRTNAWFRSTAIPKSKHHATDQTGHAGGFGGRTYVAENKAVSTSGGDQVLWMGYHSESQDGTTDKWIPANSYSATLPLIYNPYSQTQVREIEFHIDAFSAGSTVDLQVHADGEVKYTRKVTLDSTGPQKVRFTDIRADGEVVKVAFTIAADPRRPPPNEAPLLERVLVGSQGQNRSRATR